MSYKDRFARYGSPSDTAEIREYMYIRAPEALTRAQDIESHDRSAAQKIAEFEAIIEDLKEYRQDLAARYAQLETMPYSYRLELKRRVASDNHKYYNIQIVKRYEDGTETQELYESYSGKERNKALSRYAELQKQRPGIEAAKDIERRQWER